MDVLGSGKVCRRAGLLTLADAEACADVLCDVMAARGAPIVWVHHDPASVNLK